MSDRDKPDSPTIILVMVNFVLSILLPYIWDISTLDRVMLSVILFVVFFILYEVGRELLLRNDGEVRDQLLMMLIVLIMPDDWPESLS
ncbi:MAG: hypothetical protein QG551_126 [Patescibacteria group bacterium]|jgi:hypothetical protein|nr:hypothetical protein [Patescibacteria group bacterium]